MWSVVRGLVWSGLCVCVCVFVVTHDVWFVSLILCFVVMCVHQNHLVWQAAVKHPPPVTAAMSLTTPAWNLVWRVHETQVY